MEWDEIYEIGKAPKTHSTEALRSARTRSQHAQFVRFGQCCVIGAAMGMFVVVVAIIWGIL